MKSDTIRAQNTSQADLPSACDARNRNQPNTDSRFATMTATDASDNKALNDTILLALSERFEELASQLSNLKIASSDETLRQTETLFAHLDPIERRIMATPARTIAGLGVKARHAAYVLSEYWAEPVDQIDWDAKTVRLLIEAVCEVAHVSLPFNPGTDG